LTKEAAQKMSSEPLQWPAAQAAVAHWYKGPAGREDVIAVVFDEKGIATKVVFYPGWSVIDQIRRCISF
jgi:hypothetical protein